jgi:tRNA A-37 threonylcarbamoyl transferase component Bud32
MIIHRTGYGNYFNELIIKDNILIKKCKNDYGLKRLDNEKEFYKFIKNHNIDFSTPIILELNNDNIVMEYLKNWVSLYKIYKDKSEILNVVYNKLAILHSSSKKNIDKKQFYNDLYEEFYNKILDRFKTIESYIIKYTFIKSVNGVIIKPLQDILEKCYNIISNYYSQFETYEYNPIHGDCQFSNILTNGTDIVFIDPRGYYGYSKIYGIKEYDYMKIKFALTGYDIFDSSDYTQLDINEYDITINIPQFNNKIDNIAIYAMTIITWLGNAHCFIDNKIKMMISYFYALYLGSLFITQY